MTAPGRWVFGTDPTCDVRVTDEYASSQHCAVTRRDDGTVWLEDLGSMNGTFIRPSSEPYSPYNPGRRVRRSTQISSGTTIRIGRTDIPW